MGMVLAMNAPTTTKAQVAAYSFTQEVGTWQPIAGSGTPMGMPGLPPEFAFDDNSFVTQGEQLPMGGATSGNGWPIGFPFNFNGQQYDRVGLSMEGWLAFGKSSDGLAAVYVPIGSEAYQPLSVAVPAGIDPARRNRVAGFAMDLAAMGNGGTWPIQIRTAFAAPNRIFIAEWNVLRSGGSGLLSFQIRLHEGGGDPAQQIVQVVYGGMAQNTALAGQVGLGGMDPTDFNNRSVSAAPYDWTLSQPGGSNAATCRPPASATNLPQGLTFTWTPPGCTVNGIQVTDLTNSAGAISGTLSWNTVPGASSYDYIITTGASTEPALLSGSAVPGTSVALNGLPVDQLLFVYVRADCGTGQSSWGAGMPFSTEGFVEVVCGQPPQTFEHCYSDLETRSWHYSSTTPLRLVIHSGIIHNTDLLRIYDGPTDQSPMLFSSANGAIAGQVVNSSGTQLTMTLVADEVGSCAMQEFITPMEWEVGCWDCEPVLAGFQVLDDCEEGRFSVNVQVFGMGSSPTVIISNDGGAPEVVASTIGLYSVGPFVNGTAVIVTANHATNMYCDAVSTLLSNGVCPIVGCGPDTIIYCYHNSDGSKFAYSGETASDRIGIRFLSGGLASGDVLNVYDGPDEFTSSPLGLVNGGDLNGRLFTSSITSNTIMLQVLADGSQSCVTGQAAEWSYIVSCYDGCLGPEATFSVEEDCDLGRFSVVVHLTDLGSADQVLITNDAGAPVVTATNTGPYTIGPFTNGTSVVVGVDGASALCSLTSIALSDGCGVGIEEIAPGRLTIYPDPGDGVFTLVLPHGFGGRMEIEVLDLAGRRMQLVRMSGSGGQVIPLDLTRVAAGSYVVVLRNGQRTVSTMLRVMH